MTIPLDLLPPIPLPSSDEEMELGDTPLALHDTADHVPADDHSSSNSQDSAESAVLVDKPATLEEPAVQTQVEDEAPAVPSTPPLAIDTNITPDDVAPPQTVGPIESSESENQAVVATAQPKTPVIAYRSPNSTFTSAKQDDMRGERDESPAQQFQPLVESKTSSESVSTNKRDVQLANDEEDVVIERVVKKSVGEPKRDTIKVSTPTTKAPLSDASNKAASSPVSRHSVGKSPMASTTKQKDRVRPRTEPSPSSRATSVLQPIPIGVTTSDSDSDVEEPQRILHPANTIPSETYRFGSYVSHPLDFVHDISKHQREKQYDMSRSKPIVPTIHTNVKSNARTIVSSATPGPYPGARHPPPVHALQPKPQPQRAAPPMLGEPRLPDLVKAIKSRLDSDETFWYVIKGIMAEHDESRRDVHFKKALRETEGKPAVAAVRDVESSRRTSYKTKEKEKRHRQESRAEAKADKRREKEWQIHTDTDSDEQVVQEKNFTFASSAPPIDLKPYSPTVPPPPQVPVPAPQLVYQSFTSSNTKARTHAGHPDIVKSKPIQPRDAPPKTQHTVQSASTHAKYAPPMAGRGQSQPHMSASFPQPKAPSRATSKTSPVYHGASEAAWASHKISTVQREELRAAMQGKRTDDERVKSSKGKYAQARGRRSDGPSRQHGAFSH